MKTLDIYKEAYPSAVKSGEQLRIDSLKKQKETVSDRLKQEKKRQKVSKAQQQLNKAVRMPTT